MIKIESLVDIEIKDNIKDKKKILLEIENIFFEASSKKEFTSADHKLAFYNSWCGDYITLYPDDFFVMSDTDQVLGYLSGCGHSQNASLILKVPGFEVFSDLFGQYPAHLHINFHSCSRGLGLGSELIKAYIIYLKEKKIHGLHLITSPNALNVSFYRRLGFNHEVQREYKGMELLFMGAILDY